MDGYLTAATQAALLEVFGGSVVAAAALALAEDVRAIHGQRAQPPPIPSRRRGRRGRGRGRGGRAVAEHRATGASDDDACPGLAATTGVPASAWEALDAIDLQVELPRPVPTLQDVPPFLRAAVKTALLTAFRGLRTARMPVWSDRVQSVETFPPNTAHAAGAAGPPRRAGAG